MKIKVTIDVTSPEGRQIVEELKQFPDIVIFDDDLSTVAEPTKTYESATSSVKNSPIDNDYIESEVFWKLIESKRKQFCTDNGIV